MSYRARPAPPYHARYEQQMLIRLLTTALFAAAMITVPTAQAAPAAAQASFRQNLVNVPTLVVEGEWDFEDAGNGEVTLTGRFSRGFGVPEPTDYRWVLVDDAGEVEVDLSKEIQAVAEISPPVVEEFTVTFPGRTKDLLGLDAVVYQVVNVAGLKLLAETGRAPVTKG